MKKNDNILAIIPAKAGSRGLKGKIYKEICGKPLVWWTIEAARRSNHNLIIAVSSNNETVLSIAESFNEEHGEHTVEIIDRPDYLCDHNSTTESAILHALEYLKLENNLSFDQILILQGTSPLRKLNLIDKAIEIKRQYKRHSLLTVSKHLPFFFKINEDGTTNSLFDVRNRKMRQNIDKKEMLYYDDGCLYLVDVDTFIQNSCRLDDNPYLLVNDYFSSFQIDTQDDFTLLSVLMQENRKNGEYI